MNYKVIIAGSRKFNDYILLETMCDYFLQNQYPNIEIVSGTAQGADKLGERYAAEHFLDIKRFPADWDNLDVVPCNVKYNKYNKPYNALAGHNRNKDMAMYANALIAFDTGTKGTQNMISLMKEMNKPYRVLKL